MKGPEKVFADLICKYKDKGYQIPDLSTEKNLFKASPLLMEDHKLVNHYKTFTKMISEDKNLDFLQHLSQQVMDKVASEHERKLNNFEKKTTTFRDYRRLEESQRLNTEELLEEIENVKNYNSMAKKTIQNMSFNSETIKGKTNKSSQSSLVNNTLNMNEDRDRVLFQPVQTKLSNFALRKLSQTGRTGNKSGQESNHMSNLTTGLHNTATESFNNSLNHTEKKKKAYINFKVNFKNGISTNLKKKDSFGGSKSVSRKSLVSVNTYQINSNKNSQKNLNMAMINYIKKKGIFGKANTSLMNSPSKEVESKYGKTEEIYQINQLLRESSKNMVQNARNHSNSQSMTTGFKMNNSINNLIGSNMSSPSKEFQRNQELNLIYEKLSRKENLMNMNEEITNYFRANRRFTHSMHDFKYLFII
jgi:hypothetical protein